ncbi:MAG: metal ABC transporter permease [Salaquimonas sp.]
MLDDFFIRALIAGIGVAVVAGPLGCFIIWRRMAYYGDTLSHAALLGVGLGLVLNVDVILSVFFVSVVISVLLIRLQRKGGLSSDALLGLLSHSALAIGLVALAFVTWIRVDLMSLLFGDILSVSKADIGIIFAGGVIILLTLRSIWSPLFAATVDHEMAKAEGMNPERTNMIFLFLMAGVIAISMKIVGALLITALLIIPAAAARYLSSSPEIMALNAALIGVGAVISGLYGSLAWDTPSGPSIVVAATMIFFLSLAMKSVLHTRSIAAE